MKKLLQFCPTKLHNLLLTCGGEGMRYVANLVTIVLNRVFLPFVTHEAPHPLMNAKQKQRVDATGGTKGKKAQHSQRKDDEMIPQ